MVNFLKLGMSVIQPCRSVQVFIICPFIHSHTHAARGVAVGIGSLLELLMGSWGQVVLIPWLPS